MDEVENVKRFVQNLDEIGGYQDEKGKSMRNLVEEISLDLAPGDSPLHFSSQTSSAAASIDIELRIAEAKERMKQMLQDSHDICRKLSFHADDTDQTDKELKQDMQTVVMRSENFMSSKIDNLIAITSEQNDRDLALIDDSNEEDASVPNLSSKFSSIVQAATQSAGTVPALQKAVNDMDTIFTNEGKGCFREDGVNKIPSVHKVDQYSHHLNVNHKHHDRHQESAKNKKDVSSSELDKASHQVQVLVHQLAKCRRNLLTAEREVDILHVENKELRRLIRDLLLVQGIGKD